MKAWCQWCHFRIRWYPTWGAWGTPTGDRSYATMCTFQSPEGLHEPVDEKPGRDPT